MNVNDPSFRPRLPGAASWADAGAPRPPAASLGLQGDAGLFDADVLAHDLAHMDGLLTVSSRSTMGDVNALAHAVIGHLCEE